MRLPVTLALAMIMAATAVKSDDDGRLCGAQTTLPLPCFGHGSDALTVALVLLGLASTVTLWIVFMLLGCGTRKILYDE